MTAHYVYPHCYADALRTLDAEHSFVFTGCLEDEVGPLDADDGPLVGTTGTVVTETTPRGQYSRDFNAYFWRRGWDGAFIWQIDTLDLGGWKLTPPEGETRDCTAEELAALKRYTDGADGLEAMFYRAANVVCCEAVSQIGELIETLEKEAA